MSIPDKPGKGLSLSELRPYGTEWPLDAHFAEKKSKKVL